MVCRSPSSCKFRSSVTADRQAIPAAGSSGFPSRAQAGMAGAFSLRAGAGDGHEVRQGVVNASNAGSRRSGPVICRTFTTRGCGAMRPYRQPVSVGVIGDPDQRLSPRASQKDTGQVEQQHPGRTANGCITTRDQRVHGDQIQLSPGLRELDMLAVIRHCWLLRDHRSTAATGEHTAVLGGRVRAAAVGAQPIQRHHIHHDDHQRPERVGEDEDIWSMALRPSATTATQRASWFPATTPAAASSCKTQMIRMIPPGSRVGEHLTRLNW